MQYGQFDVATKKTFEKIAILPWIFLTFSKKLMVGSHFQDYDFQLLCKTKSSLVSLKRNIYKSRHLVHR